MFFQVHKNINLFVSVDPVKQKDEDDDQQNVLGLLHIDKDNKKLTDLGDASGADNDEYAPYLHIKFKDKAEQIDDGGGGTMMCDDFEGGEEDLPRTEMIFTPFVDYHMKNIPALQIIEDGDEPQVAKIQFMRVKNRNFDDDIEELKAIYDSS